MLTLRRPSSRILAGLFVLVCLSLFITPFDTDGQNGPAKFLATDFTSHHKYALLEDFDCPSPLCPETLTRSGSRDRLSIGDRYTFRRSLSSGFEGAVEIYFDNKTQKHVSIKSFCDTSGVVRNTLSSAAQTAFGLEKWPTEIPAMLLFATPTHDQAVELGTENIASLVDYFVLDDHGLKKWQLVTEFYHRGSMEDAGKRLAGELGLPSSITTARLDHLFRSSFNQLLETLSHMHSAGFCHDDIKPANIFISNRDPLTWVLGDLGQVRNQKHPYHSSTTWLAQGQWESCVLNDTRRLLKVYLSFLRSFHRDTSTFDIELMQKRENWSQLYWSYLSNQSTSTALYGISESERSSESTSIEPEVRSSLASQFDELTSLGSSRIKQYNWRLVVDHELRCSFRSTSHRWVDKLLFGIR